jgi:hypothetical protein
MIEDIPVRRDHKLSYGRTIAKQILETFLTQLVISNVELCQLGSTVGNLNQATGGEVIFGDTVERPQSWEKLGQHGGETGRL